MCGRFTLTIDPFDLQEEYGFQGSLPNWNPGYNIAPTQPVAVVADMPERQITWMRWGLIPGWMKEPSGAPLINARAETAAEKPSFRQAFQQRRCFILANGFYEWKRTAGQKIAKPYLFRILDGKPFAFAGLWEIWTSPQGEQVRSCTILTTSANEVVKPVHERMPVILNTEQAHRWLSSLSLAELQATLRPYPAEEMTAIPVGPIVNNARINDPACLTPELF